MTFKIKRYGSWKTSYYRETEVNDHKKIINSNYDEYSDLNVTLFKNILKDELDVPDYAINKNNILKEFGYEQLDKNIPDECINQIVGYYKFRKDLYIKICNQTLDNRAEALLKQLGCDELSFKYFIPAEYNNFSCEEPHYTGGQIEAYIEITLCK